MIFMDKIIAHHPEVIVSSLTIHRLLLTGIMLASKMFDDFFITNTAYARIGGVEVKELNALEV